MSKNKKKIESPKQLKLKKGKQEAEKIEIQSLHPHTRKWISAIIFFAVAVISLLALFDMAGAAGNGLSRMMSLLLGRLNFLMPIIFLAGGWLMLSEKRLKVRTINYIGIVLLVLSLSGLLNLFVPLEDIFAAIDQGQAGGFLGLVFSYAFLNILGFWASMVMVIAIMVIGLLLMVNTSWDDLTESGSLLGRILNSLQVKYYDWKYGEKPEEDYEEVENEKPEHAPAVAEAVGFTSKSIATEVQVDAPVKAEKIKKADDMPVLDEPKQKIHYKKVDLPLELLEQSSGKPHSGNIIKAKEKIQKTLESFNIQVTMGEVNVGPTVTQYELIPADGIKLSRITALQDDLALALAAHPIRMEAPIPGRSAVGVEVPNISAAIVRLRELMESPTFKKRQSQLEMPLGKDVSGKTWSYAIDKAPHLLVAGATGSGKSVCLNAIIVSLLYQNSPETLRFIMVDPKKVELTPYENIPHLLTPVVTNVKKTVNALKWAVAEMERRYSLLQKMGKKNIAGFNAVAEEKMPYIVFVIDEMADLMVAARNEVETLIIRLAQMARAVGIHLILATQRPSVDVITGLIKANVPTRIAFAVASSMDSRTILDTVGADKLIGKGDMLFSSAELSKPVRLQGAYLSEGEIEKVVNYLKNSGQKPDFDPAIVEKASGGIGAVDYSDSQDGDELFEQAKDTVIQLGRASTSLLQRKLKIGYSRAARLIDLLEEAGIVGPGDGAKPREILSMEVAAQGFDVAEEELQPTYNDDDDKDMIPAGEVSIITKKIEPIEEVAEIEEERVEEKEAVTEPEEVVENSVEVEDEPLAALTEDEAESIEAIDSDDVVKEEEDSKPRKTVVEDDWAN